MILKKHLDEVVHDKFMEELYSGQYHAGERIDPAKMANRYSISRTPVVQALKQLANEKVLTVDGGGKFFMLTPTEKMLNDVCDVRCLLEQYAISIHMKKPDRKVFEKLREMVLETIKRMQDGDAVGSTTNNLEFHKYFMEQTGNQCLMDVYIPVLYQYSGIKFSLGDEWESQKGLEKWHLKIVDYMLNNEEEEARRATAEHIDICRKDIVQQIRNMKNMN